MPPLLLIPLALAAAPADGGWTFRDRADHDGRSLLHFRAVALAERPPTPLHADDRAPAGARFGLLPVGAGSRDAVAVVWAAPGGEGTLWLDADRDGRFAADERHQLAGDPSEVQVTLSFADGDKPREVKRTLLLRRAAAGGGLLWAVRGHAAGRLALGGTRHAALLADGDADGRFDGAGRDRVWIDLDGDGKFDGLSEQFLLGAPITVGGKAYLLRPEPDGGAVRVTERPGELGALRLGLTGKPHGRVVRFSAQLVSEWGELVTVTEYDRPAAAPVGRYAVDSLSCRLTEDGGRDWTYRFGGDRRLSLEVRAGKETAASLLDGLTFGVTVTPPKGGAAPGDAVNVAPQLKAANGLELLDCQWGDVERPAVGQGPEAEVRLVRPDGTAADTARCGFA